MHQQAIIEYRYPLCLAQERRYHNEVCFTWSVLLRHPIAYVDVAVAEYTTFIIK